MPDLKDVIKSLVQQCNIESISTKDLTKELSSLYDQVQFREDNLKRYEELLAIASKEKDNAIKQLSEYKQTHVDPANKLKADREAFEKEKFKFEVQKEFAQKETDIYKEIVRSMTSTIARNESFYGGQNGHNWQKGETIDKPSLPSTGSAVKMP